ncbi:MAG: hypothetical protein K2J54_01440, partial [Clostridia bacterium]|nr:hypothetical protein [Clostridia bacterium]
MIDERADDKQIEVIAEKSRKAAYAFLALTVLGVVVAAVGVILFLTAGFKSANIIMQAAVICLTAVGAVLITVFTALFVRQLYRKYSLIILKDGTLTFPDGTTCYPNDVKAVDKDKKSGKITVSLADRKIEVGGVANLDKA